MGVWLFDRAGAQTAYVAEATSIVTTLKYREHSEWGGEFPASSYADFAAAYFAVVDGCEEVFLVEKPVYVRARRASITVEGRSASALLETRAIDGTMTWLTMKAGAMVSAMMGALTGARALPVAFGTGNTLGSDFSMQRSRGDCGEHLIAITAAQGLGFKTRMSGSTVYLDVYGPTDLSASVMLGEKWGDGSSARCITDTKAWRNFAIVSGEAPATVAKTYSTSNLVYGSTVSGSILNTRSTNGSYFTIGESATNGITQEVVFECGTGIESVLLVLDGYYAGTTGHQIGLHLYNPTSAQWVNEVAAFLPNESTSSRYSVAVPDEYVSATGQVKVRLIHNTTTYNANHRLYLDYMACVVQPNRVTVEVDQTSGSERRELAVDADDIKRGSRSLAAYQALLAARGAEKLSDTRKLEYVEASEVSADLDCGDVIYYNDTFFGESFMVAEVQTTREAGSVKRSVSLGDPPATLQKTFRRYK